MVHTGLHVVIHLPFLKKIQNETTIFHSGPLLFQSSPTVANPELFPPEPFQAPTQKSVLIQNAWIKHIFILPSQCWITRPQSWFFRKQAKFPTINKCLLPLVSATFILFSESINPTCLVLTQDRIMISFSAPWKASTVDTCTALISGWSKSTAPSKWQSYGGKKKEIIQGRDYEELKTWTYSQQPFLFNWWWIIFIFFLYDSQRFGR